MVFLELGLVEGGSSRFSQEQVDQFGLAEFLWSVIDSAE
jgi:hypothetical protein